MKNKRLLLIIYTEKWTHCWFNIMHLPWWWYI